MLTGNKALHSAERLRYLKHKSGSLHDIRKLSLETNTNFLTRTYTIVSILMSSSTGKNTITTEAGVFHIVRYRFKEAKRK